MKKLLILLFLLSFNSFAKDCNKHPIYCHIMDNYEVAKEEKLIRKSFKPNEEYVMKVSNLIHKMYLKHHIPRRVFTAILAQESLYTLKAQNCTKGYRIETEDEVGYKCSEDLGRKLRKIIESGGWVILSDFANFCGLKPKMIESKVCSDFGSSQIYYKTIKRYGFDIELLTTDLEYSIEAGAIVLKDFMERYGAKEVNWWTRYNARNKTKRKFYATMVGRFL